MSPCVNSPGCPSNSAVLPGRDVRWGSIEFLLVDFHVFKPFSVGTLLRTYLVITESLEETWTTQNDRG